MLELSSAAPTFLMSGYPSVLAVVGVTHGLHLLRQLERRPLWAELCGSIFD